MGLQTSSLSSFKLKLTHRDVILLQRRNWHFSLWLDLAVFKVADFAQNFAGSQFSFPWFDVLLRKLLLTVVEHFFVRVWRERRGRRITANATINTCNTLWNVFLVFVEYLGLGTAANGRIFLSPHLFKGTFHWSAILTLFEVIVVAVEGWSSVVWLLTTVPFWSVFVHSVRVPVLLCLLWVWNFASNGWFANWAWTWFTLLVHSNKLDFEIN